MGDSSNTSSPPTSRGPVRELLGLFAKLGVVGFGGPAAHIAMMQQEVVEKRRWMSKQHFLDLVGATNLIPGPNSTEMAIHVGYHRAGWRGLLVAGAAFIAPAFAMTLALTLVYARYGTIPAAARYLFGVKAVVVALIAAAVWRLGRTAVKGAPHAAIGVVVGVAAWFGLNIVLTLLVGGVVGMAALMALHAMREHKQDGDGTSGRPTGDATSQQPPATEDDPDRTGPPPASMALPVPLLATGGSATVVATGAAAAAPPTWAVALFFLKVGAVLYGSGYVLVAFLESEIAGTAGQVASGQAWMTHQQLLDAIAVGQVTPGPVLATATCIGYLVGAAGGDAMRGFATAAVATLAIFLPSFVFVAIVNPIVPKLRRSRWMGAFLDAVNVSAVALMAVVAVRLGRAALAGWPGALIAMIAIVLVLRWKVNPVWLVLGAAAIGALLFDLTGH